MIYKLLSKRAMYNRLHNIESKLITDPDNMLDSPFFINILSVVNRKASKEYLELDATNCPHQEPLFAYSLLHFNSFLPKGAHNSAWKKIA